MDDKIDAFARLQRLRAQGVLSEAEYEHEKAELKGNAGSDELRVSLREHWAAGWGATSDIRKSLRRSLLGCTIIIALIGTYFLVKARTIAEATGEVSAPAETGAPSEVVSSLFGAEGPWAIQTTTDPMTDATINKASAKFEGQQFDVQVDVTCSSTGDIAYTATSFDKDGHPAEMRVTAIPPSVIGSPAGSQSYTVPRITPGRLSIDFQMRADDNEPISWSNANPQYNNQIALKSGRVQPLFRDGSGGDHAEDMAAASKIVLRLFMSSGEETIEWQQDDAGFRKVVGPCLSQRQAARATLTEERAQKDRDDAAEQARAPVQVANGM